MPIISNFEQKIINLIKGSQYEWFTVGVNLGGVGGPSGGSGTPAGGFTGQLIQSKVAYDTTELSSPASGTSLVNNLNRIRYWIGQKLGSLIIQDEGVQVSSGITTIDFVGDPVVATASGEIVTVTITGIGGGGDTKQVKVSSNDTTEGYLEDKIVAGSSITVTTLNDGGDEDVEITVTGLSVEGHSHIETDITDLDHDAQKIKGIEVSGITPVSGEILVYDGVIWYPDTVSGVGADTKQVKVSSDDTTEGYLEDKIAAGDNIAIATISGGANEKVGISVSGIYDSFLLPIGYGYEDTEATYTSSGVWEDMGTLSVSIETTVSGAPLMVQGQYHIEPYSSNWEWYSFRFNVDGSHYSDTFKRRFSGNPPTDQYGWLGNVSCVISGEIIPGTHFTKFQWRSDTGLDMRSDWRSIIVTSMGAVLSAPVPPGWNPLYIAGCEIWFAARKETIYSDDDDVHTMTDYSGKGRDATQGTPTLRPKFKEDIVGGQPVYRNDATNVLDTDAATFDIGTVFAVLGNVSNGANAPSMCGGVQSTDKRLMTVYDDNVTIHSGDGNELFGSSIDTWIDKVSTYDLGDTNYHVVCQKADTTPETATDQLHMLDSILNAKLNGDMAEFIIYNTILSTEDQQLVEDYLMNMYSIT